MSSFYGGKQGRTYHIVQRYNSVQQMCEAFAGGGAYTQANYGQYVIIDTVLESGRSNLENGLLYRRGFDYNDSASQYIKPNPNDSKYQDGDIWDKEAFQQDWAEWVQHPGCGAIYVGQIVGTQGGTAEIQIETWSDFEQQTSTSQNQIVIDSRPGKVDDETFNDVIKAGYVNIRDQYGDIVAAKIAFDIPYTVIEAEVVDHNAYSTAGVVESPASTAHSFYYKWDFTVPNGKRGQDIQKVSVENGSVTEEQEDGFGNPIVADDKYFTYAVRDYTAAATGSLTEHLGRWPYRVIDGITLINDTRSIISWGHLTHVNVGDLYRTGEYLQNAYWVCLKAGRIIDSDTPGVDEHEVPYQAAHDTVPTITSLDQIGTVISDLQETSWRAINIPQTAPAHSLIISYTAGQDDQFERVLRNVDHLSVDQLGNLYAFYSDDINQSYYLTNIGGLKSVQMDDIEGIIFNYTNGTKVSYPLKQILSIDFYTGTPQKDEYGNWKYDQLGELVFDDKTQDSNLRIRYKDNSIDTFEVKRIDKIVYNNRNLNASQHIQVQYLGGQNTNITQNPINMVTAIGRQGDNIFVLYSDPITRKKIEEQGVEGKDWLKLDWIDPTTGISYQGENALVWKNYGNLGAQYHVQGEYNIADLKGDDTDPNFTIDLSEGFKDFTEEGGEDLSDRMGWLVTVTDNDDNKHLYAFDYNDDLQNPSHELYDSTPSCWYEIMQLSATMINPNRVVVVSANDNPPTSLVDSGLWLVTYVGHDVGI